MSDQRNEPTAVPSPASPDDRVRVVVEAIDEKPAKGGDGVNLSARLRAIDGPHKGRALFYTCPMQRESEGEDSDDKRTEKWGRRRFALLLDAVGKLDANDTDELLGLTVLATVRTRGGGFLDVVRLEPDPHAAEQVPEREPEPTSADASPVASASESTESPEAMLDEALSPEPLHVAARQQSPTRCHVSILRGPVLLFDDVANIEARKEREKFIAAAVRHRPELHSQAAEIERQLVALAQDPKARAGKSEDDDEPAGQGSALSIPDDAPWPEPVDGVRLIDDMTARMHRYCVLPEHAAEACALWALHTFALDFVDYSPRLAFVSAEKRSGKSRSMRVAVSMARRIVAAENCTPATMFRLCEAMQPTLALDEADAWLVGPHADDSMRGLLNSGAEPGGMVLRCVGEKDPEPRAFRVFAPVALAMIGRPPGTIEDRSIVIQMRRALPSEKRERPRVRTLRPEADGIRQRCARFVLDNAGDLAASDPDMPEELDDRAADCWRPLVALADLAGGEWPARARAGAVALSGCRDEAPTTAGSQLLADIRDVFAERQVERIRSDDLAGDLAKRDDRDWHEWKLGRPITARQVAGLLRPYGVKPKMLRFGTATVRGYEKQAFVDAWARYVPGSTANDPQHRNMPHGMRAGGENEPQQVESVLRFEKGQEARDLADVAMLRIEEGIGQGDDGDAEGDL